MGLAGEECSRQEEEQVQSSWGSKGLKEQETARTLIWGQREREWCSRSHGACGPVAGCFSVRWKDIQGYYRVVTWSSLHFFKKFCSFLSLGFHPDNLENTCVFLLHLLHLCLWIIRVILLGDASPSSLCLLLWYLFHPGQIAWTRESSCRVNGVGYAVSESAPSGLRVSRQVT